ncbi:hypothetical protein AK812_SmicGene18734 [Symbiodinium microadriaticum]|uniref:Integrase catalytic domain-containing protein n=1 Tax=Symbiodinium microadriaticum TaxID=2951 RepID=A0A1Q9DUC7_SYMMI|nr:hypothetical protein AK812_SmicGene18734 [Symbiodinium microadriaticum]
MTRLRTTLIEEGEAYKNEALDYLGLEFKAVLAKTESSMNENFAIEVAEMSEQNDRLQDELAAAERSLRMESEARGSNEGNKAAPREQAAPQEPALQPKVAFSHPFEIPESLRHLFPNRKTEPTIPPGFEGTPKNQNEKPSSVPSAETNTQSELNAAMLLQAAANLSNKSETEEGKPKVKEAETIKLPDFPSPETYRSWRTSVREILRAASDRPDEAFAWVQEVYKKGTTMESLYETGKFVTLDTKLLAALGKVQKGEVHRQVLNYKETEAAADRPVRGRQVLWMFHQHFKTNEEVGSLYSVEDLLKVTLVGDDLSTFLYNFESVIAGMNHVPDEVTLRDILLRQLRKSHSIKYDLQIFDRAKEGTPTHTYAFLVNAVKEHLTRERTFKKAIKTANQLDYEFHWPRRKAPYFITPEGRSAGTQVFNAGFAKVELATPAEVIVGHRPKAMRVPAPRHPRFVIRTTWIYKDSAWKKIEDSVDVRNLKVKNQKIEGSPILSITTFKRPEDDPLQEPDSDREAEGEKDQDASSEARLRAEADSIHHKFCHRPKNPCCKVCQKAKMYSPQARKAGGSSSITSTKYGDHITVDHIITRDMLDHGYDDQKVALVVKDVYSQFRYVYPSDTKNSDQCHEDLLHFLGKDDDVGIIYSDNAPELGQAIKRLGVRHNTSREYVDENKSVIEREIRTILEGTRANLEQSGMPEKYWPLASQHHAFALNLAKRFDTGVVPWEARFGESFTGLVVPFGAKVLYWHNPKQNVPETSKFSPTGVEGIFLGYHVQPGFIFKREYLVAPVHNAVQAIEDGTLKVIRAKRVELIEGQFVFPLDPEQIKHDEATRVPQLDDQNINNASPEADGELDDALQLMDDYLGPGGLDDEEGEGERPPQGEAVEAPQPPEPKKPPSDPTGLFDPTRYPDGTPVPAGYNWDGVRLVRNKKGSKRPPDVPSEFWHMYSAQQRKEEIERWEKKVARAEAAKREELEKEAPAMPVLLGHKEPHRPKYESNMERMHNLYLDKLEQTADELYALVAKVINQNDVAKIPEAQEAMDKEWQKLLYKVCWVESQVREFEDVQKEVKQKGQKAHFGRIFDICSLKGSELPKGHPQRKYKGRSVFQGNQVRDENADHASSSPASMEAGKIIDVFGSQPGYAKQQADARQAYTQALFEGIATWVRLPRNRWPKSWTNYRDPVCPLRLALYGHPDSGGIWEKHCTKQLRSIGWVPVLPDIWQSIFYHPELDLLLVVYVDDFKMAGPKDNLAKGWEGISKVLDMDPAEPLGRTAFPLVPSSEEEVRLAIAARKGRFKGTDTIIKEPVPSMTKPVNIMSYDMRDFLVSCVDKYCELAGKWEHALMLINHVREDEKPAEKPGRDAQAQAKKSQAAAAIQEVEMIASELSRPLMHNRDLVDFATDSNSLLKNHTEQCITLYVAQQSLDNASLNKLANNLRSLCDEGGSSNKTKPLLFFVSFASSPNEQDRDKTLKALMSLYRMTKQLCPQLIIETNDQVSWDSCKVVEVVKTFGLQRHASYASSVSLKRLLEVRPDHGRLRLSEAKVNALQLDWIATISRTQLDVDDISSDVQATKTETSLACVALPSFNKAGGNSRPIEAMDYSQQVRDFWQRQLWAGVIASESLSLQEDVEDAEIKALYQYMPVQAAAANMFDPECFPYLREVCSLDDAGMSLLMPDGSRGRKRILILVSDSTTVFVAGKKTKTNILSDLAAAKNTSLSMYTEIIYEPLWGKTLTEISARIVALIDQTIMRYGVSDPELLIDALACWQGNELVGRRGIFLNPQPPTWWDHQQGPITAEGRLGEDLHQVGVVQLLSGIRGFVYGLPKQFDECMRTIFDEAARTGLAVASMHEYCSDLPLFTDGYHFREDSQSRRKLIAGISHGIHLATAELYAKNAVLADRPGFLNLQKKHRFDPRGRYLVDSRALTESLRKLSRAKPTNAEVHTSNDQDVVDPWEDEWFEAKREEVHAAMPTLSTEELTAAIEKRNVMRVGQYRWARADEVGDSGELVNAPLNEEAATAPESSHRAGAGITAAGPQEHIWGDSILKTSGSDESAAKRARKDERLAALARNEVVAAQGAANMRRWQDCLDFAEMTGTVLHDHWNSSPSKDAADAYLVVNQGDMTPGLAKPRIDPGVRNFITGLIRGNFIDKGEKFRLRSWDGPWVLALEVLQDYFVAEEIAVGWLSPYTSDDLDRFDNALREERPIIPIEKAPPRSGKAHCYFSGEPLEEAKTKAGVRANLPVEIVFDTAEVLAAGCEVFVTESEGFLTSDCVPGHCILFINDDVKDVNLWSRSGGTYAADEAQEAAGSESPTKVEADLPADQHELASGSQAAPTIGSEFLKPPAYEATETSSVAAYEEVPPVVMETEQEEPATEADATMPSVEERPPVPEGTPIVPTELTTTISHISSATIVNIVQDVQGKAVHAYQQSVRRNEPIHYGGTEAKPTAAFLESINCCHCGTSCLEGQRICFSCGGPVKPGQLRRQNRRTQLARGREAMINQLADDNNAPRVFLSKLKSASKDVAGRGMASFEGDNIRKAKLALGKAKKQGFHEHLGSLRFTKDNTYACSLTNNGITRHSVRVMDCLVQAYLPNPGRTTTQRAMAVGSNATVTQEIGPHLDDMPHCRVVFFECTQEDLCVAGLTSTPDDAPVAFTWYGAFLSMQDLNCARCESNVQLQTFGHGIIEIRGNDATLISQNINAVIADDVEYATQAAADARTSAQRSQAAQPKYRTHLPPGKGEQKGKGKGKPREPSTPPPQRPPRGEADWSWYNRGWSDREWNQWYSEWHGWQQRGWNWR